jgi:chaperone required for assembly of F1-ATPase
MQRQLIKTHHHVRNFTSSSSKRMNVFAPCVVPRRQQSGFKGYIDDNVQQFVKKRQSTLANNEETEEDIKAAEVRFKEKFGLAQDHAPQHDETNEIILQREQTMLNLLDSLMESTPVPEDVSSMDIKTMDEHQITSKLKERFGVKDEDLQEKERLAASLSFEQGSHKIFQEDHLQKFFKSMSIHPHVGVTAGGETGFVVRIGAEQLLRSHSGRVVIFPNKHLAAAVIGEWELQRGYIRPTTLPLTELVCQWQDMKADAQEGFTTFGRMVKRTITGFFDSELVCHRQDLDTGKAIERLVKKRWDPITQWFEQEYGTKLHISTPSDDFSGDFTQNEAREAFIKRYTSDEPLQQFRQFFIDWVTAIDMAYLLLDKLKPHQLVILYAGTQITKSILIPVAMMHGKINYKQAIEASQLQLRQQTKAFGLVEGEHDVIFAEEAAKLAALELFKTLVEYENN